MLKLWQPLAKALLYSGLALTLFGLAVGKLGPRLGFSPATVELVMAEGDVRELDGSTSLELERFVVPTYPSGKPRQYVSSVKVVDRRHGQVAAVEVSVNHPLVVNGWWIYQYSCGNDELNTPCTVLKCVVDRGLPMAAAGGLLLIIGALAFCFCKSPPASCRVVAMGGIRMSWVAGMLTVALPVFIIGRALMRPEPVPALQSWMLYPHVGAYLLSYLIMIFAAFGIGRRFVPLGFLLMTFGLVLGAAWGKFAWSEWWQFDPKENWSFATWLIFAAYLHFPPDARTSRWLLRIGVVVIVITLTWVNFSKIFSGLHSYA